MDHLDKDQTQWIVRQHRRILAAMNIYLTPASRILDFGCGEGTQVYGYRDAGLQAYGFDIRPAPAYHSPDDEQWFRFSLTGKPVNVPEFSVDPMTYRIPFDSDSFDFVFSTSTMEHVQDHELAFAETARVLKKGGVALHTFPGRYVLIEPHIYVPLGGAIQSFGWFLFWALLGVRNEFQRSMGPIECAKNNLYYAQTGLKYPRLATILATCRRYYSEVELVPRLWELADHGRTNFSGMLLFAPRIRHGASWIYSRVFDVALYLRK